MSGPAFAVNANKELVINNAVQVR
ncbi:protein of unknown function [Candidatus Nitrosacidococcus tergens]|uniref:Uncharacterized protein n=1 Tax=Candidatus Nitrosacidococcus tergens TaxID=553981 RepID=A0A7G1Q973_9GAMM|nr:protein of unknown function [Candidatus Nitrosacidococcus tergens]